MGTTAVGGLWAAPVVVTLARPAMAAGSPSPAADTVCDCTHLLHLTRNADDTYSCSDGPYSCDYSPTRYGPACTSDSCAQIVSASWASYAWAVVVTFACTPANIQHAQDCFPCGTTGARPVAGDPHTFELPSTCRPASTPPDELDVVFTCTCTS